MNSNWKTHTISTCRLKLPRSNTVTQTNTTYRIRNNNIYSNTVSANILIENVWFELYLQETVGKDCKITEPYYNITFDLTPLRKDGGYKINGFDNDQLDFNICGRLNKPCGDAASVAACLDKNNKKLKFGKQWNDKIVRMDGLFSRFAMRVFRNYEMTSPWIGR